MYSNRDYYDKFAPGYEKRRGHGYHKLVDDIEAGLVTPFAAGKRVLEIGCGTGLILDRVARVAQEAIGIDLSPRMVEIAQSKGLSALVSDVEKLPFPDAHFDVVYSFKVLAHVRRIHRALTEIARVVRPGGRVFLEFYNRQSPRYLIRRLRGGHPIATDAHDNEVYFRFDSRADVLDYLPKELSFLRWHGVRLFTLLPSSVAWPLVGPVLSQAEKLSRSSLLSRWAGFIILECERAPTSYAG